MARGKKAKPGDINAPLKDVETRRWKKPLPVRCTPAETERNAQKLAEAELALHREREAKAESNRAYAAKIKDLQGEVKGLALDVKAGTKQEEVEVETTYDWPHGSVKVTRLDTGEVVEERPMRTPERQRQIPLDEPVKQSQAPVAAVTGVPGGDPTKGMPN